MYHTGTGITLDPMTLLPEDKKRFLAYAGSLTTPPCSQGVEWYLPARPITLLSTQAQPQVFYQGSR